MTVPTDERVETLAKRLADEHKYCNIPDCGLREAAAMLRSQQQRIKELEQQEAHAERAAALSILHRIVELEDLLQEVTEGLECFEHQTIEDPIGEQATCACGAAICPEPDESVPGKPDCLLGRVDRALGHRSEGACQA